MRWLFPLLLFVYWDERFVVDRLACRAFSKQRFRSTRVYVGHGNAYVDAQGVSPTFTPHAFTSVVHHEDGSTPCLLNMNTSTNFVVDTNFVKGEQHTFNETKAESTSSKTVPLGDSISSPSNEILGKQPSIGPQPEGAVPSHQEDAQLPAADGDTTETRPSEIGIPAATARSASPPVNLQYDFRDQRTEGPARTSSDTAGGVGNYLASSEGTVESPRDVVQTNSEYKRKQDDLDEHRGTPMSVVAAGVVLISGLFVCGAYIAHKAKGIGTDRQRRIRTYDVRSPAAEYISPAFESPNPNVFGQRAGYEAADSDDFA